MNVVPFVSNVIQNICTFDALLTSHQLGWSIVPLKIMMALALMEVAAMPCHLEFVEYLTGRSVHVPQAVQRSGEPPAPRPSGINLESEQENASNAKPKMSDLDSPMLWVAPPVEEPLTTSKQSCNSRRRRCGMVWK